MPVFLAMLRGINLGRRTVLMNDLKKLFEELGFQNVTTYIQSGNVLFESNDAGMVSLRIEEKLAETYGFQIPVIIRTPAEIQSTLKTNPFLADPSIDISRLHITFLAEIPLQEHVDNTSTLDFSPDKFVIKDREIYLYCPDGYGITKLNNTFFEKKLRVTTTTRNWRTVNELARLMNSHLPK